MHDDDGWTPSTHDLLEAAPRRHPLPYRIVAAVAIGALVLSVVGVGIAIAQGEWGPPPGQPVETTDPGVPA